MNIQKVIKENALSTQAYFDDLNKWVTGFQPDAPGTNNDDDDDFVKVNDYTKPTVSTPGVTPVVATGGSAAVEAMPRQGEGKANQALRVVRSELRVSDVEMATRKKDEGNQAFKQAKHKEALSLYELSLSYVKASQFGEAPESAALRSVILANRALVYLKTSDAVAAVHDCTAALEADPQNVKATFRRAQANTKLCKYDEALRDLLLCKDAVGQEAEVEIQRVKTALEFQKEKQRSIARKIITDSNRKIHQPLRPLSISEPHREQSVCDEPPVARTNAPYVPKSVRMAGGSAARPATHITTYGEFERLWREKSRRRETLELLDVTRLTEIFRESLDFEVFAEIIDCALSAEFTKTALLLQALTKVRRFGLIVGLLDKDKLKVFVGRLEDQTLCNELTSSYAL